jgi:hypothetical protein
VKHYEADDDDDDDIHGRKRGATLLLCPGHHTRPKEKVLDILLKYLIRVWNE